MNKDTARQISWAAGIAVIGLLIMRAQVGDNPPPRDGGPYVTAETPPQATPRTTSPVINTPEALANLARSQPAFADYSRLSQHARGTGQTLPDLTEPYLERCLMTHAPSVAKVQSIEAQRILRAIPHDVGMAAYEYAGKLSPEDITNKGREMGLATVARIEAVRDRLPRRQRAPLIIATRELGSNLTAVSNCMIVKAGADLPPGDYMIDRVLREAGN